MTDKVLTDEEKDALLEGMSTGEIEVQSNEGPQYAEVKDFEIGPRSRIATNTYPRLQMLNRQLASRMSKQAEQLLNVDTEILAGDIDVCSFSEFGERLQALTLAVEFSAAPLKGPALVYLDSGIIGHLVESFFGGVGNKPVRHNPEFFTPGEISVTSLFVDALLNTIQEVWQSLIAFSPERVATRQSTDIVDNIETTDEVICIDFSMAFADEKESFHIVWPTSTVASLKPVFEGQKRERDPAEDTRWYTALRSKAANLVVNISSNVGHAQLTLAEAAKLSPGDIIDIDNPRKATVFAQQVAVLEGRFGVHDGCNAIEATRWLDADCEAAASAR